MANPPSVGTLEECDFRSPGSSKRFFTIDTLMMDGIAIKVITKAVMQVNVIVNMNFKGISNLDMMDQKR